MCEAGIQMFHQGSDVIPAETGGCVSSGFAHGSREVEVGGQPADGRTERLWVPRDDEAGLGFPHDLGCPDFRRDYYRNAASHSLEHGITKVFRVRRQHEQPRCGEQTLLFGSNNGAGQNANSIRNPQLCSKFYKFGNEILVVGATTASVPDRVRANACKSRSRPFFQLSLPQEQHEQLFRCYRLHVRRDVTICGNRLPQPVRRSISR